MYTTLIFCLLSLVFSVICNKNYLGQDQYRKINSVFTYTPEKGWASDPNGCVYVNGLYHLMYQHNPNELKPGIISWGHSVSRDLVHWQDQKIAVAYNTTRAAWSGNGVYDIFNNSLLCSNEQLPIIIYYTGAYMQSTNETRKNAQIISIAYSCDKAYENYTDYKCPAIAQPPLKYTNEWENMRDPNIIWYEPHSNWVMSVVLSQIKTVIWFTSKNMLDWKFVGHFSWPHTPNGVLECPSLTEFKVVNTNETKWVLILSTNPGGIYGGSGMHYHVGHFDGYRFVKDKPDTDSTIEWFDYGADCYAGILWNNVSDRKIMTIWNNNWRYSQEIVNDYKGALSSRQLVLNKNHKLQQSPIDEIYNYVTNKKIVNLNVQSNVSLSYNRSYKIDFTITDNIFDIQLKNSTNILSELKYTNGNFTISRYTPELSDGETMERHSKYIGNILQTICILLDNFTMTVFINDGLITFTELIISNTDDNRSMLFTKLNKSTQIAILTLDIQ